MTELEKYKAVNKCESFEELARVIQYMADENGDIKGRIKFFNAEKMAWNCRSFSMYHPELLTREFGIRQQAMYIAYYTDSND